MKDYLATLVRAAPTHAHGRNVVREYLQARFLGALQRAGAMIPLAFHGGAALTTHRATTAHRQPTPPGQEAQPAPAIQQPQRRASKLCR
jgi:hypothetical protein